jgi:hypothetical protein
LMQYEWDIPFQLLKCQIPLFDLEMDWIPGRFVSNTPSGRTIIEQNSIWIEIQQKFEKSSRIGPLSRKEVIIHEMIHAARSNLMSSVFEEYFAFQTSRRSTRKASFILGTDLDQLMLVFSGILSVLRDVFPAWVHSYARFPFWLKIFHMGWKWIHVQWYIRRACRIFARNGVINYLPILIRLTDEEIYNLTPTLKEFESGRLKFYLDIYSKGSEKEIRTPRSRL